MSYPAFEMSDNYSYKVIADMKATLIMEHHVICQAFYINLFEIFDCNIFEDGVNCLNIDLGISIDNLFSMDIQNLE